MWRFHRAWCAARVSFQIPVGVWGLPSERLPETCPLCAGGAGCLQHLIECCTAIEAHQEAAHAAWGPPRGELLLWALRDTPDVDELAAKVRLVGVAASTFAPHAT